MNNEHFDIDEAELHAWVDGGLEGERAAVIRQAMDADPALASRAKAYAEQNKEIRALFGSVADEPLPERLRAVNLASRTSRRRRLLAVAASVVWLSIGIAGGWLASDWLGDRTLTQDTRDVARAAVSAHRVYAVEVLHPVEVFADEEEHLVKWLSKRLDHNITAPNLTALGLGLVGGRLLPTDKGEPAAQFLYEDQGGRRVTVYVSLHRSGKETAFRYQEMDGAGAFVWLEPEMGYAITGDVPRESMLAVSRVVYETFEPTH